MNMQQLHEGNIPSPDQIDCPNRNKQRSFIMEIEDPIVENNNQKKRQIGLDDISIINWEGKAPFCMFWLS